MVRDIGTASRGFLPATRKETALWLIEKLAPDSAPNNLSLTFTVSGELDRAILHAALTVVFTRYDALRSVFVSTGPNIVRYVLSPQEMPVEIEDLSADADRALVDFVTRAFGFDGRPMLRAGLLSGPDGQTICLAFHHLIYDVISGAVLLADLAEAYNRLADGRDAGTRLREHVPVFVEPEPSAPSVEFWRRQLADFDPGALDLACGTPGSGPATLRAGKIDLELAPRTRAALQRLTRDLRAPEAVVMLAAYAVLLAAHGVGPDMTIGSPVDVRPRHGPGVVGNHTNVLPRRIRVDGAAGFRGLVSQVRGTFFDAMKHAAVPEENLPELVPGATGSWQHRLCRHLFNYFPGRGGGQICLAGRPGRLTKVENGYSKYDLEFLVLSAPDVLRVTARYSTDKLAEADATALLHRYEELLQTFARDGGVDTPTGPIPVWCATDRAVIGRANQTAGPVAPATVLEAVFENVRRTPLAVAVVHGDRETTYRQLWDCAERTRSALLEAGVAAGTVVAIAARRGAELLGAALGIWLAGGAYLPVDVEHPEQRTRHVLTDSGTRIVLADDPAALPADLDVPVLPLQPASTTEQTGEPTLAHVPDREDAAYLIYTSGSSGAPKGTWIAHRSLSNIAVDYVERLRVTPRDVTLWLATFAFDIVNLELYVPLWSGGRIAVAPDAARADGLALVAAIDQYEPSIIQATPTTWRAVLDRVGSRLGGRRIVTGGEMVPLPVAQRLLDAGCEVHHAYGPTETTTYSTWGVLPRRLGERLDIGVPIRNTRVMVAGPGGRALPIGVRGELWIAGDGVTLGYHQRPELNAQQFGDSPDLGRFYRTGDMGRWTADGTLEIFGRADRQIKLRGNRIDLGEVEGALLSHPHVAAAAVIVAGDRSSDGRLVAFIQPTPGAGDPAADMWEHARQSLPRVAIPAQFIVVDVLPTNANEKVDYLALTRMAQAGTVDGGNTAAMSPAEPDDELVSAVLKIWRDLLQREDLDVDSNFFMNGGHSLLGAQLLKRVEDTLGAVLRLADLFDAPTPAGLAKTVRRTGAGQA
jgi:amino acid adenylation domain-containing protein